MDIKHPDNIKLPMAEAVVNVVKFKTKIRNLEYRLFEVMVIVEKLKAQFDPSEELEEFTTKAIQKLMTAEAPEDFKDGWSQ